MRKSTENISPLDLKSLDRFVKMKEAAEMLGYASSISIVHLHANRQLRLYKFPNKRSKRVLLSDINKLICKQKSLEERIDYSSTSKCKPGRKKKYQANCE